MSMPLSRKRPGVVTAAFVVWLVAILAGLATAVIFFISAGTAVAAGESSIDADFAGITYVFAGAVVLLFTVIEAAIVPRLRVGRNWARVTLTVLAVLQIFNAVFSAGLNPFVAVMDIVAHLVAVVLMYVPASNRYFGRLTTETQ